MATTAASDAYRASAQPPLPPGLVCTAPLVRFGNTVTACPPVLGALPSLVPSGAPPLAPRIATARTAEGTAATDRTPEGTTTVDRTSEGTAAAAKT